mgnify:CR=1 FL=1
MNTGLIIFIYCIAVYGFSNMMVFSSGPFKIFEKIREWSEYVSEHFSSLLFNENFKISVCNVVCNQSKEFIVSE